MKFLFVDVETTGVDPELNGLIQLAGIIEIDGVVKEEFDFKARPFKGQTVDFKALEVNGVSIKDLRTWPDPHEVYLMFKAILDKYIDKYNKKDKFYAVGQNVGFDISFLKNFFKNNNDYYLGSYIHYHKIDLIPITTILKLAGRIALDNMKLKTVMSALGMGEQTHNALDDVRIVRKVFYKYIDWVKV